MFTVVIDGNTVYDPNLTSAGYSILQPQLTVGLNKSGEFKFVIPPTNPSYDLISHISSRIFILNNGSFDDVMWFGRVLTVTIDFDKKKSVYCEGALSYLVDSTLRPYVFTGSPNGLFEYYIGKHNAAVDPDNTLGTRLTIGTVNVDAGTEITEYSETYVSTLDELQEKLLGKYGGYIRARWDSTNNVPVLDYISDIGRNNSQLIQYGRNLMDLVEEQAAEDIYTVAIPLGANLYDEETNENLGRVSIKDYPNEGDPDYILAPQEFIDRFGRIEKTFVFDYIETQEDLYTIGQYLTSYSAYIPSRLTIKAIDLGLVDDSFTQIKVGDLMSVVSDPHGVDRNLLCTAIDYDLFEPGSTTYNFEIETTYVEGNSLSKRQNDTEHEIRSMYRTSLNIAENTMEAAQQQISDAMAESSALISNMLGGYVYKTRNELFIMDTDSIETATKVWRWNLGGLAYWTGTAGHALDPGATYTVAITMDGTVNAQVLRGTLVDTLVFNAVLGNIGGWQLSSQGIYKVVEDADDPTKVYRVYLYPPSTTNPGTAKVLTFEMSEDSGATFNPTFYIQGNGSIYAYGDGETDARFRVVDRTNSNYFTNLTPQRLTAVGPYLPTNSTAISQYNATGWSVEHRDTNNDSIVVNCNPTGIAFASLTTGRYTTTGRFTNTDFGVGHTTVTVGGNTWDVMVIGSYRICRLKLQKTVAVTNAWGNIYCGFHGGGSANFPSIQLPYTFQEEPFCTAQLSTTGSMDGWLVTNVDYSPTGDNVRSYTPAYDVARGTSGSPTLILNYLVIGEV